jgi:uncharacterized protein with HEPN domain
MKIPHVYIEDMIEAIELINSYLKDVPEDQFSRNTEQQDAVIRRLSIIGEAATKLSDDIKKLSPEIPWKIMVSFRNIAIHEYANVAMGKVWEIYKQDLSPLHIQLTSLLKKLPPPPEPKDM